jgi:hypothetical protein
VYALGDFGADIPIGCIEQQEAENPHIAQLVLEFGEVLFVLKANIIRTEVIGTLVGDTLHLRRVGLRKGGRLGKDHAAG